MLSNNYLFLIWKDPTTRQNYVVGKLTYDKVYTFEYCDEAGRAETTGWKPMGAFPEYKKYTSEKMFSVFSSRLPDRKRRDITDILNKYGLKKYDEFELLKKSGARLPIDTYEFIDPIFEEETAIEKEFYIMGVRYYLGCKGNDCSAFSNIDVGDALLFEEEPTNPSDEYAIKILTKDKVILGYVPRYYNKAIIERLEKGISYTCKVIEANHASTCCECIKVRLNMPKIPE